MGDEITEYELDPTTPPPLTIEKDDGEVARVLKRCINHYWGHEESQEITDAEYGLGIAVIPGDVLAKEVQEKFLLRNENEKLKQVVTRLHEVLNELEQV